MSMVKIKSDYRNIAQQWIDFKSTYDDISVGIDIGNINDTIWKLEINQYGSINEAESLHNRLVNKCTSIASFNNAVQSIEMASENLPSVNLFTLPQESCEQKWIERLKADSFGIIANVLLKHGVITEVKELIENVSV